MKSHAAEALMWAQRVMRNTRAAPNELLQVSANATAEQVQEAFHKIARSAHPDLFRNIMTPEELELLTSAYATVAGAYQAMRTRVQTPKPEPAATAQVGPPPTVATATQQMSPKALVYYRKAELCLKRGDLKGAVLQLKLACAADPQSGFLRTALAEVQTEARKLS